MFDETVLALIGCDFRIANVLFLPFTVNLLLRIDDAGFGSDLFYKVDA